MIVRSIGFNFLNRQSADVSDMLLSIDRKLLEKCTLPKKSKNILKNDAVKNDEMSRVRPLDVKNDPRFFLEIRKK